MASSEDSVISNIIVAINIFLNRTTCFSIFRLRFFVHFLGILIVFIYRNVIFYFFKKVKSKISKIVFELHFTSEMFNIKTENDKIQFFCF